jgi:pimeloyl-ACP methyl ester carboxylesterase
MLARHETLLPLADALGGGTLFDMPGHGQSADWDGYSTYQAQTASMAAALCNGPSHVIGHSFGATVALRLAVERPDLVSNLTLIEPVFFAAAKGTEAHDHHRKAFRPFIAAMLQGDEARAAQVFNTLWGEVPWDTIPTEQQAALVKRIHLVVAGGAEIEEDADGITSADRLAKVDIPVTLVRGQNTQPVIAAIHDRLVERLPHAADHVIAGAGHMLPIRKTYLAQVAAIIRASETGTG